MKRLFTILSIVAICLSSCTYDDTELSNRVENLENRVTSLEKLCKEMNSNISALQTIVEALQKNDYVTGVTPVEENGVVVGYTITFAKSAPITIYHGKDGVNGEDGADGKDGADGYTPIVGVRQDIDGIYYWTLDGEWLLDEAGNKIKAVGVDGANGEDGNDGQNGADGSDGTDGKDGVDGENGEDGINGITPQLKIENDYWYISYDNGTTWTQLGKAKGEDGKNYCEFFEDITEDEDEVIFTLIDGTVIRILKDKPFSLELETDRFEYSTGMTYQIGFTITGATIDTVIEVIPSNNLRAHISNYSIYEGVAYGDIVVEMPKAILEYATVAVIVSDGRSKVIMKAIHFDYEGSDDIDSGILYVTNGEAFNFPKEGGELDIDIQTNISYRVEIDPNIQEWLSIVDTRSSLREETLTLSATENTGIFRHGFIYIVDISNNHIVETIYISQNSDEVYYEEVILFHETFNSYMVSHFDVNKDGVVTRLEALEAVNITVPSTVSDISGLEYCVNLKHLKITKNSRVTSLDTSTFALLESLDISGSAITTIDLSNNPLLKSFNCSGSKVSAVDLSANNKLETIDCSSLGSLTNTTLILDNHRSLTKLVCNASNFTMLNISGCPELYELNCSNNSITELDVTKSPKLENLTISHNAIYELDLSKSVELRKFDCSYNSLRSLDVQACMKLHEYNFSYNPLQQLHLGSVSRLKDVKITTSIDTHFDFNISGLEIESFELNNTYGAYTVQPRIKNVLFDTPNIKSVTIYNYSGTDFDFSTIPSVESIKLTGKNIYNIDITKNPNLKSFQYSGDGGNNLKEIDFSQNSELTSVVLYECGITGVDLSNNLKVTNVKLSTVRECRYLNLGYNPVLKELDPLSGRNSGYNDHGDYFKVVAPLLESLKLTECGGYIDVTECPNLTYLQITPNGQNNMEGIDLSQQKSLKTLILDNLKYVPEIDLTHMRELESLRINGCDNLSSLYLANFSNLATATICNNVYLTEVNMQSCSALTKLECYNNERLESLNLKFCSTITGLTCYGNSKLSVLDVSDCVVLDTLDCYSTPIEKLDLSNNPLLRILNCYSTQIEKLDVSYCPLITNLDCSPNDNLTTLYMAEGQTINGINNNRNNSYIPETTEIVYK